MSSTRHTVIRGPSLVGLGNRPVLTPFHHVDLLTGMTAGIGGSAFGFPIIWGSRRYPASGSWWLVIDLLLVKCLGRSNTIQFGLSSYCIPGRLYCITAGMYFQSMSTGEGYRFLRWFLMDSGVMLMFFDILWDAAFLDSLGFFSRKL